MYEIIPGKKISKGNFSIELLKHSANPEAEEVFTFLMTYERMVHAEVMTHRWSRNASSSRAIPFETMLAWIDKDPACHLHWGKNQKGMQSSSEEVEGAREAWLDSYRVARAEAVKLYKMGLHKEIVNRVLEPWGWITTLHTMGRRQLMNAFKQRANPLANPNAQHIFVAMAKLVRESQPQQLGWGQWHLPFVEGTGTNHIPNIENAMHGEEHPIIWSVARSAWCSYNNPTKDATYLNAVTRWVDCIKYLHMTPCEHQLMATMRKPGLVPGFKNYRSMIHGECADFDMSVLDDYGDSFYQVS